jgi:hypothetical protein
MSMRFVCLALLAALVAGCATRLPDTTFAKPAALERAMNRYYEAHATEQWGYCLTPYIDGLTQVAVVESRPSASLSTSAICTATGARVAIKTASPPSASATPAASSPSARGQEGSSRSWT